MSKISRELPLICESLLVTFILMNWYHLSYSDKNGCLVSDVVSRLERSYYVDDTLAIPSMIPRRRYRDSLVIWATLLCGNRAWTELKWPAQSSAFFSLSEAAAQNVTLRHQLRWITCSENASSIGNLFSKTSFKTSFSIINNPNINFLGL